MELDGLLSALEERANTARTIFMLLDSDADGLVAVEQLGSMLTSMLLSQSLNYEGDVEEFVLQITRHRRLVRSTLSSPARPLSLHTLAPHAQPETALPPSLLYPQTKVNYGDFVDIYNALVDRIKLRACMSGQVRPAGGGRVAAEALRNVAAGSGGSGAASSSSSSSSVGAAASNSSAGSSGADGARPRSGTKARRNGSGSAYLVSGAALKMVNGVYTQSGESDGVPKYTYTGAGGIHYQLLRRNVTGTKYWYICETANQGGTSVLPKMFFCLRSTAGTPPLEVPWERAKDGLLPGPFLTPISLTHAPPTSVLAPITNFEVGDFVRANWAGRGVMYPGEVLAINQEDDTLDILYDDGDFESHVPRERVHAVSIELTDAFHAFGVGDVVKADLKGHGSWYTGRIIAIDTKFRVFTIKYENGHLEKHVPPSRVQPMSTGHIKSDYVHGERVRANWQSCGTWCLGRICAVNHAEGTFNVQVRSHQPSHSAQRFAPLFALSDFCLPSHPSAQYDDGEVELHVAAHSLQPAEDAEYKTPAAEAEVPLPFHCTLMSKAQFLNSSGAASSGAGPSGSGPPRSLLDSTTPL